VIHSQNFTDEFTIFCRLKTNQTCHCLAILQLHADDHPRNDVEQTGNQQPAQPRKGEESRESTSLALQFNLDDFHWKLVNLPEGNLFFFFRLYYLTLG
jgi:hypothetical protein